MNNVIFKHELCDAWSMPINSIMVLDSEEDNIIIDEEKHTIPYEDIETIKESLDNPILYNKKEILSPPILDGTTHKVYLTDGSMSSKITALNLWYWLEDSEEEYEEDKLEYTLAIVKTICDVQEELDKNSIKFNILNDE